MKRWLYLAGGFAMVGLGVLGMFLPVLPTTPFLLLAAFFFARSSPRLYNWLASSRYLGPYIESYRTGCGVPLRLKIKSIAILWMLLGISCFFYHAWWYWMVLALVGVGVTTHLALLKTKREAAEPPGFRACGPGEDS